MMNCQALFHTHDSQMHMAEFTQADLIWSRACCVDKLWTLLGDRARVDLLGAHDLAMNGGVPDRRRIGRGPNWISFLRI